MTKKRIDKKLFEGRSLASELFDIGIKELAQLNENDKKELRIKYPSLSDDEFNDVLSQTINAKKEWEKKVSWQIFPRDIAILIFVLVSWVINLKTGILCGIISLVLFENIFQLFYNSKLCSILIFLTFLHYPILILFSFILFNKGYDLLFVILIPILTAILSYVLGMIVRLPLRYFFLQKRDSQ